MPKELVEGAQANARANPSTNDDLLKRVARMDPHNAHRDLVRALKRSAPQARPPLDRVRVPLWDSDKAVAVEDEIPMALPHEWVPSFGQADPASFCSVSPEVAGKLAVASENTHPQGRCTHGRPFGMGRHCSLPYRSRQCLAVALEHPLDRGLQEALDCFAHQELLVSMRMRWSPYFGPNLVGHCMELASARFGEVSCHRS